ncbi:MAG: hypothetical protein ACXW3C_04075 [Pyrinomonadaceae bacterium]
MNLRIPRFRVPLAATLLCAVFISPTFVVKHTQAATPPDLNDAATRFTNISIVPEDPEATYQGARIVHNVTVAGVKGMRVHANFTVKYGYDVSCRLIAYFYYDDSDNTPLKSSNAKYRTKEGNVSASVNFKPAYDPAVYKDYQLFVPYDALNMESSNEYDLKFYLALYDNEGQRFFGKSGWYKFHLTVP